ncbi:MAG: CTP synthase [Planctomycetaceae bacterium]|nr:CTP synthase [Planctomycetaceae bacterium]
MTKHIFITGGVVSSLGKGLTAAALGMLLEARGLRIRMQKLDPYLNIDPGTMSPYQHGEVYVLDDGAETDLDLGHYERFTKSPLSKNSSWTTGKIYRNVLRRERKGKYLGKTVQVIPHITDEIKRAIRSLRGKNVDVVLTEVGGTVGDIESLPFLEAIRQFALDIGRDHCLFLHLTLIPYLKSSGELKTKPTQHSVSRLRQIGIQPDILICRSEQSISEAERNKIGLFCSIETQNVIEEKDADFSIYEVPVMLQKNGLDQRVVDRFWKTAGSSAAPPCRLVCPPDLSPWFDILDRLRHPLHEITIAVVGKYAKHKDAYKSIYESLDHAGIKNRSGVRVIGVPSDELNPATLEEVDGILVPGGFGDRGVEGKIAAIRFARERQVPFFGICLGMQCAVIEFARNVCGCTGANSTEFEPATPHPVITLMDEQRQITDKGGTMRLGAQPTVLVPESKAFACYFAGSPSPSAGDSRSGDSSLLIFERHRHRFEFNNDYRQKLTCGGGHSSVSAGAGLLIAGTSPDGKLVEVVEIAAHPWFVGVQYHPEFKSQPTNPHPLFDGFVAAAVKHKLNRR